MKTKMFTSIFLLIFSWQAFVYADGGSCKKQGHFLTLDPTQQAVVEELGSAFLDLDQYDDATRKELIRRNNLARPYSYTNIVLNGVEGAVRSDLGEACFNFLKVNVYGKGESLYAPSIYAQAVSVTDFPVKSGDRDLSFYHYTNARSMLDQLVGDDPTRFESTFKYLRESSSRGVWSSVLYTAEDSTSTKSYGYLRVTFEASPKTKVIESRYDHHFWDLHPKAMEYLEAKFPGLKKICMENSNHKTSVAYDLVKFLIFEDSGIGMASYYGVGERYHNQHFQVISPEIFEDAELNY